MWQKTKNKQMNEQTNKKSTTTKKSVQFVEKWRTRKFNVGAKACAKRFNVGAKACPKRGKEIEERNRERERYTKCLKIKT